MLASMASCFNWLLARRFRRVATILAGLILSIATIVFLVNNLGPAPTLPKGKPKTTSSGDEALSSGFPLCSHHTDPNVTYPLEAWRAAAETKYGGLLDDKFTYVEYVAAAMLLLLCCCCCVAAALLHARMC